MTVSAPIRALCPWANAVLQNCGVCGQAFPLPLLPSPLASLFCSLASFPAHLKNLLLSAENVMETLATQATNTVTPNIDLHTHLVECILNYGPVYSFWLFSFEWYNDIIGDYATNQRAVEIQLMRNFMSNQFIKHIPLPVEFQEHFESVMERLVSKQAGSLQNHSSLEGHFGRKALHGLTLTLYLSWPTLQGLP